ncbi:hypothetical protein HPP92_017466 [Vanilla planifolia]|uniref:Protein LURP-one-related 8 n=1 Tax=Vanilla planifolia TaxID=51239 RepID=A0A835Q849_VANPL|nr:hypothetical protein HPP92_018078 [Vanilla planifolia]KAG0468138.1 hypothetical protein HPP92_017466 [Vanilla planifolia]
MGNNENCEVKSVIELIYNRRPSHRSISGSWQSIAGEMTRIYPKSPASQSTSPDNAGESAPSSLTVWRKSLLLNCSGFTVFDAKGNLEFRVDNYSQSIRNEIVLMDAAGKPLFTVRRKKLSLVGRWKIYDGEADASGPRFSATRRVALFPSLKLARLISCRGKGQSYGVEGSFSERSCTVFDERQRKVAEILPREAVGGVAFGSDVFRLVVEPEFDAGVAMSIVILLEQMFG